ncbi:uncharacterized protein LOC121808354 isoform X2 [Salvia splendens]|uniref:uncharacterized protein LOC121808354 isoform X1 n=1 Tax=Salvia splendens TaxID=180675 RepID=UPI001C269493|nr:uncharacterized protein LOC121808354 isoform X1 [Salvia splendens]XP_042064719.1 uncharacterized protein LOC121808354 isoform X2 [Salvia splendens]
MDPQAFIRLSIGSLGIRFPGSAAEESGICSFSSPCVCEIRLRGFPVQTTPIPFVPSPEATPNSHSASSSFYLEESDLNALLAPGCLYASNARLEIVVFMGRKGSHCGVGAKRQQIGALKCWIFDTQNIGALNKDEIWRISINKLLTKGLQNTKTKRCASALQTLTVYL